MSIQLQYNLSRKMVKINENLVNIRESATLAINELSKKLESDGKEVFKFGLGQSPFPVPKVIVEELKLNADQKDYLNVAGLLKLRESIALYHSKKNNYTYDAEDILVGPGSKELIFQTQLVLENDLILSIPSWVSYAPQAKILNKKIHWLKTTAEQNWHLDSKELNEKCKTLKNKKKFFILNSPNNPSGTIHPNLKELAEVARLHELIIIADEIYAELNYSGKYESITHYYPEGTIISSGISKWCGAGGWRLGTLIFPKKLKSLRNAIRSIASETFTSVSAPIQYAAIKAYTEDHTQYLKNSRKILSHIGNYIYNKFYNVGIRCQKPQGGFYMLCDFSKIISKTNEITDSRSLCNKILEETGFAMLPGEDFGMQNNQLITRIAFVDFDGKNALEYVSKNSKIDKNFIDNCCPKIIKGIESLINWIKKQKL